MTDQLHKLRFDRFLLAYFNFFTYIDFTLVWIPT